MANARFNPMSPMEMRILSALMQFDKGASPTDLACAADVERASLYVHLRRMYDRKLVTSKPDRTSTAPGAVIYSITAAGKKAREAFAKNVGLSAAPSPVNLGLQISEYQLAGDPRRRGMDDIKVCAVGQLKGKKKWAVRHMGNCLNKGGEWEYEPQPSSRDDAFLARCRFDTAMQAARAAVAARTQLEAFYG